MKILGFIAENFKRLRIVEITPKGHVVQITGKNSQGKTSVLDAIWAGLAGAKAMPERPVRKGAVNAIIKLDLGEVVVTRQIHQDGTHHLLVENAEGAKQKQPQQVLDQFLGQLSFDPLEFISLKPKQQVEILRQVAKIDIDVDSMNLANKTDYEERTGINREIEKLAAEIRTITVQEKLPKAKIDETAIFAKIAQVDAVNATARKHDEAKQKAIDAFENHNLESLKLEELLKATLAQVQQLEDQRKARSEEAKKLQIAAASLPNGIYASAADLTGELAEAQLINREIDKRSRRDLLQGQLNAKTNAANQLTRQMDDREETKHAALEKAQMPIEGLMFDENMVSYHGIPVEQLGDAEKIRISTAIAMAANPKLRVIRILHGEALDEDSFAILAEMAEEHDYQIWVAKVDSTGKVGIVMEDGTVKAEV